MSHIIPNSNLTMLEGHSGSKLKKQGSIIEKQSSYLANAVDAEERGRFLIELSEKFPSAPKIIAVNADVIRYEYVTGEPGFEKADLTEFGKIVRSLHELQIEAPEKETGLQWLKDLAATNLQSANAKLDLSVILSGLEDDKQTIVHGEITDVLVDETGKITILDWDEAGRGSKYQDIGYIYFKCQEQRNGDEDFGKFLASYDDPTLEHTKILQAAGLIAVAYSRWANKDFRLELGLKLLRGK